MAKIVVQIDTASKAFKITRDGQEITPKGVSVGCAKYYDDTSAYWASYTVEEDGMEVTHHIHFYGDEESDASEYITNVDYPAQAAKAQKTSLASMKLSGLLQGKLGNEAQGNEDVSLDENDDLVTDDDQHKPVKPREYSLKKYDWKK